MSEISRSFLRKIQKGLHRYFFLSPLSFPLSLTLKAPRPSPSVLADLFRPGQYGSRRWIRRILLLLRSRNSQRRLLLRYSHRLSETRSGSSSLPKAVFFFSFLFFSRCIFCFLGFWFLVGFVKKWHPDRWAKNQALAGEAKRRFQQIQEAYSGGWWLHFLTALLCVFRLMGLNGRYWCRFLCVAVLSDASKKSMYDAGFYDPMEEDQVCCFLLRWFSSEFDRRWIKRRRFEIEVSAFTCGAVFISSVAGVAPSKRFFILFYFLKKRNELCILCCFGLFQYSPWILLNSGNRISVISCKRCYLWWTMWETR